MAKMLGPNRALREEFDTEIEETSMTGYTVHTGSTDAFANNYDQIFGAKKAAKKKTAPKKKSAKVAAKKKKKRTKPKK